MKNKFNKGLAALFTALILLYSCGTGKKTETGDEAAVQSIMVFSAASLTDVLSELVDTFQVKYNVEVKTNMASSGTLARQIAQGGSPDVYISASKKWANYVDSLGAIVAGTKTEIAQNQLVLIAPASSDLQVESIDSSLNFLDLLGSDLLSMGDPSHVPAGKYAKQSLEYFGWYSQLDKKTNPAKDVRSALMVVEMSEAPVGIVYRTDAMKSGKVKILNTFPERSHKPIVYVAGVCKNNQSANDFLSYINSDEASAIWAKYGFKK